MGGTRFMVQWEEHPAHLAARLGQLLEHQTLVDVTLMCNTHTLRVHRAVLAACSPYFQSILTRQLGSHPLIVLKDMQFSVLKSLIEFMYCGETSVSEDNLGPLLQAAKFFQVKGLSAMTKEALGLTSGTSKPINGDGPRKAFVGKSKRVAVQQNFMTKALPSSSGSASQMSLPTDSKQSLQIAINSTGTLRQAENQQQTDTAQLLLSLSGSEFHKQSQSLQSVTKGVRFQNAVGVNTMKTDTMRTVESTLKPKNVRAEVVDSVVSGVKYSNKYTVVSATHKTPHFVAVKEGNTNQPHHATFLAEAAPVRKRGRPVKRQTNVVFQEKVLTDADMALHKEAEASRKALEVLRQEMAVEPRDKTTVQQSDPVHKIHQHSPVIKQPISTVNSFSRITPRIQTTAIKKPVSQTTYLMKNAQKSSAEIPNKKLQVQDDHGANSLKKIVPTPEPVTAQVVNTTAANTSTDQVLANSDSNIIYQMADTVTPNQEMFQIVENPNVQGRGQNIVYQVTEQVQSVESETASNATNIVYQMADNSSSNANVGQYMEALKGAGIPADIPIYLDSGDGSFVTLSEEMLMSMVNAGVLQCHVAEGNVEGDRVEFIVQETDGEIQTMAVQQAEQIMEQPSIKSADTPTADGIRQILESETDEAGPDMPSIGEDQPESIMMSDPSAVVVKSEPDDDIPMTSDIVLEHKMDTLDTMQADIQTGQTGNSANTEQDMLGVTSDGCRPEEEITNEELSAVNEGASNNNEHFSPTVQEKEENVALEHKTPTSSDETYEKNENILGSDCIIPDGSMFTTTNENIETKDSDCIIPDGGMFTAPHENVETKDSDCIIPDDDMFTTTHENVETKDSHQTYEENVKDADINISDEMVPSKGNDINAIDSEHQVQVTEDQPSSTQENQIPFSYTEATGLPSLDDDYTGPQENSVTGKSYFQESNLDNVTEECNLNNADTLEQNNCVMHEELEPMAISEHIEESKIQHEVIGDEFIQKPNNSVDEAQVDDCNQVEENCENSNGVENTVVYHETMSSDNLEDTCEQPPQNTVADLRQSGEMSVEQALEAMMGDDSGSGVKEAPVSNEKEGNEAAVATNSVDNIEKKKEHSNNEELCLMLSRDDDGLKVSSSNAERELMETFMPSLTTGKEDDVILTDPENVVIKEKDETEIVSCSSNIQTEESSAEFHCADNDETHGSLVTETRECRDEEVAVPKSNEVESEEISTHTEEVIEDDCGDNETLVVQTIETQEIVDGNNAGPQKGQVDVPEITSKYVFVTDCHSEGQVISPNKDIPFAVGLLPLKTALEKFQSMPDHQPRKTRSSSTGKEGASDQPTARVKRKASSTDSGPDKKIRLLCDTEEELFEEEVEHGELHEEDSSAKWTSLGLSADKSKEGLHAVTEMVNETTEV